MQLILVYSAAIIATVLIACWRLRRMHTYLSPEEWSRLKGWKRSSVFLLLLVVFVIWYMVRGETQIQYQHPLTVTAVALVVLVVVENLIRKKS